MEQSLEMQLKKLCWLIEGCQKSHLKEEHVDVLADRAKDIWDPHALLRLRERLEQVDKMSTETLENILDEFIA